MTDVGSVEGAQRGLEGQELGAECGCCQRIVALAAEVEAFREQCGEFLGAGDTEAVEFVDLLESVDVGVEVVSDLVETTPGAVVAVLFGECEKLFAVEV